MSRKSHNIESSSPFHLNFNFKNKQTSLFQDQTVKEHLLDDLKSRNNAPGQPSKHRAGSSSSFPQYEHNTSADFAPDLTEFSQSTPIEPGKDALNLPVHNMNQSQSQAFNHIWRIWWREALSTLLATLCLASIILIMYYFKDKATDRQPTMISINSMISIFSTLFKAALIMPLSEGIAQLKWEWFSKPQRLSDIVLFDAASRGPLGSLKFISKNISNVCQCYLPILGAFITITALAIEPFTQSVVRHVICRNELDIAIPYVSRTNNYSASTQAIAGETMLPLDPTMEAALYTGLVDPANISSLINVHCGGFNCTFERFSSLAMCHSCQDLFNSIINDTKDEYKYSLPSGVGVDNVTALSMKRIDDKINFLNYEALMLRFDAKTNQVSGAFAAGCTLNPCVKVYSGFVENNAYHEFEEDDDPVLLQSGPPYGYSFSTITNYSFVNGQKINCNPSNRPEDAEPFSIPIVSADNSYLYYPRECVWWVVFTTTPAFQMKLDSLLQDNIRMMGQSNMPSQTDGKIWLQNLFSGGQGDLRKANDMFSGLASTTTAAMRNSPIYYGYGTSNLTRANGTAYELNTCIKVRWPWILYPATLLFLQIIFIVSVFLSQKRLGLCDDSMRRDWKSSPLVLLFHSMDKELSSKMADTTSVMQMEIVAENTNVHLRSLNTKSQQWQFQIS